MGLTDDKTMLSVVDNYYATLEKTGYVKHGTVVRLLAYEFLVDFINNTFFFITEEDYQMIDSLLKKLFTNGGCLLPYPVFCTNRVKLAGYGNDGIVRITEDKYKDKDGNLLGNQPRITEDGIIRIA